MEQRTELYNNGSDMWWREIDKAADQGWFVHSMVSTRLPQWERAEMGDNDHVLVVYLRAGE